VSHRRLSLCCLLGSHFPVVVALSCSVTLFPITLGEYFCFLLSVMLPFLIRDTAGGLILLLGTLSHTLATSHR